MSKTVTMSLDISLRSNPEQCEHCSKCLRCSIFQELSQTLFSANITHNLTGMAEKAGIYEVLWRSEENGITKAAQLVEPLYQAILRMKVDPESYRALNAENSWGTYEQFLPWLERLYSACMANPNATVSVDV